jgi:hypothetical protein
MTFNAWIDTFLNEKQISRDDMLTVEGASGASHIPVGMLVDMIKTAPKTERDGIKAMMVRIDFAAPGSKPVMDYLAHLARAARRRATTPNAPAPPSG